MNVTYSNFADIVLKIPGLPMGRGTQECGQIPQEAQKILVIPVSRIYFTASGPFTY